jgi:hypothetical protein
MKFYPFSPAEQDAVRFFGMSGYRYVMETKKVIAFFSEKRSDWIYFNREAEGTSIVVALNGRPKPTAEDRGMRASSNFHKLPIGPTSRGKMNHQGRQFALPHGSHIPSFLTQLNGTVP